MRKRNPTTLRLVAPATATNYEIGSELDFDETAIYEAALCSVDQLLRQEEGFSRTLLGSGRAAIRSALRAISTTAPPPLRFLVPSYLCPAVLQPFHDLSIGYDFYPVDDHLCVNWDEVRGRAETGHYTGLLFIRYFGSTMLDNPPYLAGERQGFYVIEDLAQAMLSPEAGRRGDYVIFSLRKFFGLPDGGAVITRRGVRPRVLQSVLTGSSVSV